MKSKLIILISLALGLVACGQWPGFENSGSDGANTYSTNQIAQNTSYQEMAQEGSPADVERTDQSIIQTASLYYDTIEYDLAKENLLATIEDAAIIENQTERNYQSATHTLKELNMTLRVPAAEFSDYMVALENIEGANLTQMNQSSENVTKQIQDTKLHQDSIEARIDRLNELNEQAETVSEIIEIESALSQAILERDQIISDLAYLNDQVDMSTMSIVLKEVLQLEDGSGSQISWTDQLSAYLGELGFYILQALNYSIIAIFFVLPFILLFFLIRWIIRR